MAEKTLQKVEDELTTCSICLDTYSNPKLLQCFHVYCQGCLVRLVFRDQQRRLVLTCPNCRQVTPVPAGGVAGLQSAFHINRLLGIMKEHKNRGDVPKQNMDQEEKSGISSSTSVYEATNSLCCTEHTDESLKLYCETCGKLICLKCAIKGGRHSMHEYELVDDAFAKYKEEIGLSLEPVEKQMAITTKALQQLDISQGKITDLQATIEAEIHSSIGRLQEILSARKNQLLDQLDHFVQCKLKNLASQRDQLETTQAQLGSCIEFVKRCIDSNSSQEVMSVKASVLKQVKELTAPFPPDFLEPCVEADMLYTEQDDLLLGLQNYGQLEVNVPDPSKCYASGMGLTEATVNEKSSVIVHSVNCKDEPCSQVISLLECELISEVVGTTMSGVVERTGQSTYEVSYKPAIKGQHQLHIKVEGQHIRGSPFSVKVKSSFEHIGTPIHCITKGVDEPCGITLNHKQGLVISDTRRRCIHTLSPATQNIVSFGARGSDQGQFRSPMGLTIAKSGDIFVVDKGNHRIQKFKSDGQFLASVGTLGDKHLQFENPSDIVLNTTNEKLYITDTLNHRVQALNFDLTFFTSVGKSGRGQGQFSHPHAIACDSSGNVYVADKDNNRVQIFTADLTLLGVFGSFGKDPGNLNWPIGISISTTGLVYISEEGNHRISVFTLEGQFVKTFGSLGGDLGQFYYPRGVVVDDCEVLYVCDLGNERIQVF